MLKKRSAGYMSLGNSSTMQMRVLPLVVVENLVLALHEPKLCKLQLHKLAKAQTAVNCPKKMHRHMKRR
jgi:hypothetical protein